MLNFSEKEIDSLLQSLTEKVNLLRKKVVEQETARLIEVNNNLKKDIAELKVQLTETQLKSGGNIYEIPNDDTLRKAKLLLDEKSSFSSSQAASSSNTQTQAENEDTVESSNKKTKKEKSAKKVEKKSKERSVDVSVLDLRVGHIRGVKKHPDADTLYVEEIDCGEESPRTVCSALVDLIPMSELDDRLVIVNCNMKPIKMRGIESQAMLIGASSPDKEELLDPPQGAKPGDKVHFEGYEGEPLPVLNPKRKIFEAIQADFWVDDEGVATWKKIPFQVGNLGVCKSKTARNMGIR